MEANRPRAKANPRDAAERPDKLPSQQELTETEIARVFDALGLSTDEDRATVLAGLAAASEESELLDFASYLDNSSEERASE